MFRREYIPYYFLFFILVSYFSFINHQYIFQVLNFMKNNGIDPKAFLTFENAFKWCIDNGMIPTNTAVCPDSRYYSTTSVMLNIDKIIDLVKINKNLLVPILTLVTFKNNLLLLGIFYLGFYLYALNSVMKTIHSKKEKSYFIKSMLLFPPILMSFYGYNKEISTVIALLFLINCIYTKDKLILFFIFIFSLLSRMELFGIVMIFLLTYQLPWKKKLIFVIMMMISIAVYIYMNRIVLSMDYFLEVNQREDSFGLLVSLDQMTRDGFYIITTPIKILGNLFYLIIFPNFNGLYPSSLTIASYMFLLQNFLILRKYYYLKMKFTLFAQYICYFIVLYCIVFSIPPYLEFRYFYPLFPMLVYLFINLKSKVEYDV